MPSFLNLKSLFKAMAAGGSTYRRYMDKKAPVGWFKRRVKHTRRYCLGCNHAQSYHRKRSGGYTGQCHFVTSNQQCSCPGGVFIRTLA